MRKNHINFIFYPVDPNDAMIVTEIFESFGYLNPGMGNDYEEVQFYDGNLEM